MFKFEQKLKNRMEKWTKKKRITCEACAWILMILASVSILFGSVGSQNSQVRISLLGAVIWLVIVIILCYISYKVITIINSVISEERQKEKEDEAVSILKQLLSYEEYRKVIYSPYLRRYKFKSNVSYEDEELKHCTSLLDSDGITNYAILVNTHVDIIAKNKEGKQISIRTVDAINFCKNYTVLKN